MRKNYNVKMDQDLVNEAMEHFKSPYETLSEFFSRLLREKLAGTDAP